MFVTYMKQSLTYIPYLDPIGYPLMSQEEVAADGCPEDAAVFIFVWLFVATVAAPTTWLGRGCM